LTDLLASFNTVSGNSDTPSCHKSVPGNINPFHGKIPPNMMIKAGASVAPAFIMVHAG
jgi:hypothetical protein